MSAREDILNRIRRATGSKEQDRARDYGAIARDYRRSGTLEAAARVDLLADRLRDYNAGVYVCKELQLAETIAHVLAARGKRGLVIPPALPAEWLPAGFDFMVDGDLSYEELDGSEGVLTGCAVAIAFTGTIVLRHGPGDARRALTLIPDYHVCVVRADQVVETVPEAIGRIRDFRGLPLTTISGPSATSDIEMTRVKGVHGPRTLDVAIVHG